ncbi:MAG TPA: hypothetical protein VMW28_08930 [Pelolinea sp.]|nr:hypothetical protein [Pelolinea sp.]
MLHIEIKVASQINPEWAEWFKDFTLSYTEKGETTISGEVIDQSALYGLLSKLRDLGMKLIHIETTESKRKPGK